MARIIFLSYPVNAKTPVYPGDSPVLIKRVRQMEKGDACNTSIVTLSNHTGTHMDAPRHFLKNGKPVDRFTPGELSFARPHIVNCRKGPDEPIAPADVRATGGARSADILLIKTGFGSCRAKDPKRYCHNNPYLLPEAAEYIVRNYRDLRAVGIDTVSVSSKASRDLGRESHKILLGSGIFIIEDVRFIKGAEDIEQVAIWPVFTGCADGTPCIIAGVVND